MLSALTLVHQGSSATVVAGPYLQLTSTPGTTLVQVIQKGKGSIEVSSSKGRGRELPGIPMATPNQTVRRFVLDGITAGREFSYTVKDGAVSKKYTGFASFSQGQPTRIALLGDSGRGLPGQRLVAKQLSIYKPKLLVHVGDIVYPRGRESEYMKYHFPVYGDLLTRTPSAYAPGNHDTAYRDLKNYPDGLAYYKLWHTPTKKEPWAKDRGNFSFGYGDGYWVILDSNTYNNWRSTAAQTWLRNELKKGAGHKWRFVAFHHPPYHSSDKKKTEIYMRVIAPILEQAKVNIVFCGHVHNYQRAKPTANGPYYIVTGAGGAELYDQKIASDRKLWQPFTQAYVPGYSFTSLEYDARKLSMKQIDSKGKVIDQIAIGR